MSCIYISDVAQIVMGLVFFSTVALLTLLYLDGYWSPERRYQRWLTGNSFDAIDERHRLGVDRFGRKLPKR